MSDFKTLFTADLTDFSDDELLTLEREATKRADSEAFIVGIDYNITDVELIERLEEKIGLLGLVFTLSYYAGINYSDAMGTTAMWDSIIFRYLAKRNIAIPQNKITGKVEYDGGFVKDSLTGRHEWNVSFDLNSLYPMIMVQYNMSPETIVKHMKRHNYSPELFLNDDIIECFSPEENLAITPNGSCFRRDKIGVIPMIVEDLYSQRVEIKNKMLAAESLLQKTDKDSSKYKELETEIDLARNKQTCIKICLNSSYGAFASRYFRYYDIDIAEGITHAGQYVVQSVEKEVNKFLKKAVGIDKDYITMMDTDSCFFDLSDIIKKVNPADKHKFCVDFSKTALEPVIERTFETIAKRTNAYRNMMKMKLEKVSEVAIFTKKKRYILKVLSSEGVEYREPKIVMKGIEAIKSSTPKICRTKFKELFNILVDGTEDQLQKEIAAFEDEFKKQKIESLAFPKSVSHVKKYEQRGDTPYIKGTPINSRAAILYNKLLKEKHLTSQLSKIKNGDRLKFIYLKPGNPLKENVIGFIDKLPVEFGLHDWIDYDVMFSKTFLDPFMLILKVVGWKCKPTASLESFFS